jgi:hypothetical protein
MSLPPMASAASLSVACFSTLPLGSRSTRLTARGPETTVFGV